MKDNFFQKYTILENTWHKTKHGNLYCSTAYAMPQTSVRFQNLGGRENPQPPCVFKGLLGQIFPLVTLVQIQGNPTKAGACPSLPVGLDTWLWPMEIAYMSVTSPRLVLLCAGGD